MQQLFFLMTISLANVFILIEVLIKWKTKLNVFKVLIGLWKTLKANKPRTWYFRQTPGKILIFTTSTS